MRPFLLATGLALVASLAPAQEVFPLEAGVFICDTQEQVRQAVDSPKTAIDGCGETKVATAAMVETVERHEAGDAVHVIVRFTFLGVIQNGVVFPRPPLVQFGVWEVEDKGQGI